MALELRRNSHAPSLTMVILQGQCTFHPMNFSAHYSLWKSMQLRINESLIQNDSNTFHLRSFLSKKMSFGGAASSTWRFDLEGAWPDTAGHVDSTDPALNAFFTFCIISSSFCIISVDGTNARILLRFRASWKLSARFRFIFSPMENCGILSTSTTNTRQTS